MLFQQTYHNRKFAIMVGSYHNSKYHNRKFAIMVGSYHNSKWDDCEISVLFGGGGGGGGGVNLILPHFTSSQFCLFCHSRSVPLRAELVLLRGGLPSEIALQVQNCVSKGRCRFRKNRKYIFGSQGHMKRGENWFP